MQWPNDKLARFEVARLIGARSLQIALGAPILIKTEESNPTRIAKLEFREKLIPMTIKRKMPNGQYSVVNIKRAVDNWVRDRGNEF